MTSQRKRTWRNALVAAINAGLEQRIFGLGPTENYWLHQLATNQDAQHLYRFTIENIPAEVCITDIGFGELYIHAAFWPKRCDSPNPNYPGPTGLVEARGSLERLEGPYLRTFYPYRLRARRDFGREISELAIEPMGFDDKGPLRL